MSANEKSGTTVKVELDPETSSRLEDYRRSRPTIPSKAQVVREFLVLGLENAGVDSHA
jgi:hypothetical protein